MYLIFYVCQRRNKQISCLPPLSNRLSWEGFFGFPRTSSRILNYSSYAKGCGGGSSWACSGVKASSRRQVRRLRETS